MRKLIAFLSVALVFVLLSSCGGEKKEILPDPEIDATVMVELCHNQSLTDADMSPDGKYIVTVSRDHKLIIWDLATKREVKLISQTSVEDDSKRFSSVDYTNDGKLLVVGTYDDKILFIDAETLEITNEVTVDGFGGETIALSHDDKYVAVEAENNSIQ
ncbi:MAG: cytochrome D1 domain-containing protein, partial [Bacteroidota bacterium]|nr:cytochrome D1 domain-containing protein [Bacteroidota bacterium]